MHVNLNDKDRISLEATINHVLNTIKRTKKEPEIIAQITIDIPQVVKKWDTIQKNRSNIRFYSCGAFVHGHPLVKLINTTPSSPVEIGDLLLITNIIDNSTKPNALYERRALLMQAKKHDLKQQNGTCIINITPQNNIQHTQYNQWQEFQYTSPQNLRGQRRYIQGLDVYAGTQYLLINKGKDSNCNGSLCPSLLQRVCPNYLTAYPEMPLGHFNSFADELVNFILGNIGKMFKSDPASIHNLGWDNVIHDLIGYCKTHQSSFVHKTGKKGRGSRWQNGFCAMQSKQSNYISNTRLQTLSTHSDITDGDGIFAPPSNMTDDEHTGFGVISFCVIIDEPRHD